jgi:glucose/mannose-6-phosphate isomerase
MDYKYNIYELMYNLPEQIKAAKNLQININIKNNIEYQNIVISGMGGSGIGGDILKALLADLLSMPIITIKDYFLPAYVNNKTLLFAVSYSGNTEETLQCFTQAQRKKCHIISITSGGKLLEMSKKCGVDYIELPKGPSSRCAIGYLFVSLLL